ncbi:hypothetical protein OH77DRAFT_546309 [Trametes cingulata]|nr:hypothetical protein OH77DRAFT_546309 [Trametes cingulata]
MPGTCPHCLEDYTMALSRHIGRCHKLIFDIHEFPNTKTGPTARIERNSEDMIICRCLDSEGEPCKEGPFTCLNSLMKHLKKKGPNVK